MVIALSYIIAVIITVLLAIVLYPISAIFFVIGKIGYVLGNLADFIFTRTNSGIKKLWSDIRHTRVVRDADAADDSDSELEPETIIQDIIDGK